MKQKIMITASGLQDLQAELNDLVNTKRPALVNRLSIARSMGDLSENSDYISAKEELSFMDGRIAELEEFIRNAKVTTPSKKDQVDFGHIVEVKNNSHTVSFKLVGEWEADPTQKMISVSSPLGQALMGKKVGDKVEVSAPVGKIEYTILNIS